MGSTLAAKLAAEGRRLRGLGPRAVAAFGVSPVVIIEGARAVGKTTLCRSLAPELGLQDMVDLSDEQIRAEASADPSGFVRSLRTPALIDEAQLVDGLTVAVKREVDRSGRSGQFLLTGSTGLGRGALGGSDPLVGRAVRLTLRPLTISERAGAPACVVDSWFDEDPRRGSVEGLDQPALLEIADQGGLPTAPGVLRPGSVLERDRFFDTYIEGVLHLGVGDRLVDRSRLLQTVRYLSANPSQILVMSRAASELGMSVDTLARYVSTLERSQLIWTASSHRPAEHRVLTSHPRVFPVDTGMAAWSMRYAPAADELPAAGVGALVETFVTNECASQAAWSEKVLAVRHWRDTKTKTEVDLVLIDGRGRIVGVEVKASSSLRPSDAGGLERLAARHPDRFVRGIVVYAGDRVAPLGKNCFALPASVLVGLADLGEPGQ